MSYSRYRYFIPSPSLQLLEVDLARLDICLNGRQYITADCPSPGAKRFRLCPPIQRKFYEK
jgi:hypothetical protein